MSAPLKRLARFEILGELGRGAMGVVYKATDPALDRTVAIKTILLPLDAAERAAYEARFLQEARAAGKLGHPAIITIYDVGREGDLAYIAMEMLHGTDLRQRMSQGRLSPHESGTIAMQIADGLAFAHEHGVVHRDIKPANIMLLRGDRVKIMDFGIARMQTSDIKTQTGVLLGTPKYMSPEQVAGRPLDERSDIFSLGCVLYEMWTGRPAFSGTDVSQLMHNIAQATPVAPGRLAALPPIADLIITRALAKDPNARYQKAADLASDLRSVTVELPKLPVPPHLQPRPAAATPAKVDKTTVLTRADAPGPGEGTVINRTTPAESGTVWAVSRRFDSTKALQRLSEPTEKDRAKLARLPQPPGTLMRMLRDPDLRLLSVLLAAAIAGGVLIATA
ncbi:MAG: protein kinase domain-containing protein [Nevskiaceae bacterium]